MFGDITRMEKQAWVNGTSEREFTCWVQAGQPKKKKQKANMSVGESFKFLAASSYIRDLALLVCQFPCYDLLIIENLLSNTIDQGPEVPWPSLPPCKYSTWVVPCLCFHIKVGSCRPETHWLHLPDMCPLQLQ